MTTFLAVAAGLAVGIGAWLVVVGLLKREVTPRPPSSTGKPFAGLLRLIGLDEGGPLYSKRRTVLVSAGAGFAVGLFTGWWSLTVIVPVMVVGLPALFRTTTQSSEVEKLIDLTAWVRSLIGVLSGGAVGLEQGIAATLPSAAPSVRPSLARLVARLEARQPIKPALYRWADEMDDYSSDMIASALILESDNRTGAVAPALKQLAESLSAQARARREIETERATGRATVRWVTVVTLVVLGGTAMTGYLDGYDSAVGQIVAVTLFSAYCGCLLWMRRISMGQPIPRFLPHEGGA
ncbi:type II secretion system F family protein [Myceligenerans xiligouense]|uniref:Flp pilus assembly protein TadB n=1 Tax=Myceligenerans xiligouense TaxID=253184 RepID=A0A3N4ZHW5_9MICO|nr:type II secretion system F family protein [Myceligenerans xiligouense]RPF19491.1 Flp pilus assembly protein TadB [Myceligenerans xiligouense]